MPSEKEALEFMGSVVPAFLGLMVAAMVSTMNTISVITFLFWLVSAAVSFWSGFRVRSALRYEVNGPLEWLAKRMPLQLSAFLIGRPMFLFDFWTIGVATIFFLLQA